MAELPELLYSRKFTKQLLMSIPYALLVFDESGRVLDLNNASMRLFGSASANSELKENLGVVLNCLKLYENHVGCENSAVCNQCEIRNLALTSISVKQSLDLTTHFRVISNGQVREVLLSLFANPYRHKGKNFCLLTVENLSPNAFRNANDSHTGFHGIIGQNERMLKLFNTIRQIRSSNDPVLIQGESGTGKELVALAIHRESTRAKMNFVPVNCAALPEGLLESEMFGHVKGAFTGANFEKKGRFKLADKGTIFLDEVSELNSSTQAKFLRIIETGAFEPVGSDQTVTVNVRVISATNRLIESDIEENRFRQDLYFRLCVIPILVPPLRDRKDDIPLLVEYFLNQIKKRNVQKKINISKEAKSILMNYQWPGNVRQLQNVLKFAVLKCQNSLITPEHFPYQMFQNKILYATPSRKPKLGIADVADALRISKGNKRLAAQKLGVSRSTLYRFFDRLKSKSK